jgi:hypothetical protein
MKGYLSGIYLVPGARVGRNNNALLVTFRQSVKKDDKAFELLQGIYIFFPVGAYQKKITNLQPEAG